jgi:penicillin-binding protein 2
MDIFGNFKSDRPRKVKSYNYREYQHQDETLEGISDLPEEKQNHNFFIYYSGFFLLVLILVFKLFNIQIVQSSFNEQLAEGNRVRPRIITAPRGVIYDNKGNWLARNIPSFALAVTPSDLPRNQADRDRVYQQTADLAQISEETVKKTAEENGLLSLDPVVIKGNLPREEALILEQKTADISGISVIKKAIREYSVTASIGNIIGYSGKVSEEDLENNQELRVSDDIGKLGIEKVYDQELRGTPGVENVEVDSKGRIERVLADKDYLEPKEGENLVLNINADLQNRVAEYLRQGIEASTVKSGTVVAMNPKTGGIISMVTIPYFDNNLFAKGISNDDYQRLADDPDKPLFNRSTNGTYPPGSIIKPLIASAALQEGTINENTAFDTPAEIAIGEYIFPDWKDHGYTDVRRAIAESNNIFFYSLGGGYENIKGLGPEKIRNYLSSFGLGQETGIDFSSEASGLIPDPEWKKRVKNESWYLGDTYHESIGQGDLLVTPIQMLTALSAVANGGKLLEPHLVKSIGLTDEEGATKIEPEVIREGFISSHNIEIVRQGMRMAVTEGSARSLSTLPFTVAGKTGTAQFFNNQKTHAWFECFAPYEDPEIALVVLVEGGGAGNEIAVPIAENVLKAYFELK